MRHGSEVVVSFWQFVDAHILFSFLALFVICSTVGWLGLCAIDVSANLGRRK